MQENFVECVQELRECTQERKNLQRDPLPNVRNETSLEKVWLQPLAGIRLRWEARVWADLGSFPAISESRLMVAYMGVQGDQGWGARACGEPAAYTRLGQGYEVTKWPHIWAVWLRQSWTSYLPTHAKGKCVATGISKRNSILLQSPSSNLD